MKASKTDLYCCEKCKFVGKCKEGRLPKHCGKCNCPGHMRKGRFAYA